MATKWWHKHPVCGGISPTHLPSHSLLMNLASNTSTKQMQILTFHICNNITSLPPIGMVHCITGLNYNWTINNNALIHPCQGTSSRCFKNSDGILCKSQNLLYPAAPRKHGMAALDPLPDDLKLSLDPNGINNIQQIVGSILCHARAVNLSILILFSTIAKEQAKATTQTIQQISPSGALYTYEGVLEAPLGDSYCILCWGPFPSPKGQRTSPTCSIDWSTLTILWQWLSPSSVKLQPKHNLAKDMILDSQWTVLWLSIASALATAWVNVAATCTCCATFLIATSLYSLSPSKAVGSQYDSLPLESYPIWICLH